MTINPQRAQALFLAALELAEPAARLELLDRECSKDAALRQRVEALLGAHDAAGGFGVESSRPAFDATIAAPEVAQPGSLLAGRYKLIEAIGEGGMGSVWLAEQREPVRRKVAIKLIKAGMDSKQVLARFDAERQALAVMDHPNIAKVFDGGMTEQGRPYFVMEYVKGVPLTEYCDQARLSLKERLNLFMPVCQAVQHAHQKGIIHRDLKPSNILICLYDGKPVPKVIDFGLAKAMHQSLTEHSLHTAHGVMVGTPLYMSPEQAEHNNLDVDTRTDIYSLGVILYELLTGSTPLEKLQLKHAAFNEVLRLIKEVEPQKPSTRLSSSLSLPSIAAQRSIEPSQLKKSLIGDLDWIVMKALDKERSRRYETANGLARDIDRFLNDEAVEACPPSSAYRLKKLLRRNKGTVLATSLVLLALIAGTAAVLAVQARANTNLRSVNRQLDTANTELQSTNTLLDQQRTRAEEREQQAIGAVKRFGDAVTDNAELKEVPSLESLRKTLLKEPLAFFKDLRERLQADADTTKEALARLAQASSDLGRLFENMANIDLDAMRFETARERLKQAVIWQKKALAANPRNQTYRKHLVGHQTNLIKAARGLGDTEGAAQAERELAELKSSDPLFVALDARLVAVLKGETPQDNPERLALAQHAYDTRRFVVAATLFAEALAADSKLGDDRQVQIRYNAACCAALAASNSGKDEPPLDDVAKTTLRKQALEWLTAELASWVKLVESGPAEARALIAQTLEHWQQDSDLAAIRDEAELAQLSAEEQTAFKQLWAKVAELLEKSKT